MNKPDRDKKKKKTTMLPRSLEVEVSDYFPARQLDVNKNPPQVLEVRVPREPHISSAQLRPPVGPPPHPPTLWTQVDVM